MTILKDPISKQDIAKNALFWPSSERPTYKGSDQDSWVIDLYFPPKNQSSTSPNDEAPATRPSRDWYRHFLDSIERYDWPSIGQYDYERYWGDGSNGDSFVLIVKHAYNNSPPTSGKPNGMAFANSVASITFLTNLILCLPAWNRDSPGWREWAFNYDMPYAMPGERILYGISKLLLTLRVPVAEAPRYPYDPWRATLQTFQHPIHLLTAMLNDSWSENRTAEAIVLLHLLPKVFTKLTARVSLSVDDPESAIAGHMELLKFATINNDYINITGIPKQKQANAAWWPYNARPWIDQYYSTRIKALDSSSREQAKALQNKVIEFVKDVQRVTVLTVDCPWLLAPLIEQGITSAYKLCSFAEHEIIDLVLQSEFYKAVRSLVDDAAASSIATANTFSNWEQALRDIHKRAISITARNQHGYVEITQFLRGAGMRAIDGDVKSLDRRAALARALQNNLSSSTGAIGSSVDELVGIIDTYNVEEAYTVHSPAAYFVELLDALPNNARDLLFHRRPDIRDLHLSAANTSTTIPYLDLAIETMESFLFSKQDVALLNLVSYNTDPASEARDLETEPENSQLSLYSLSGPCNKATVPFTTGSFDLGVEHTRLLLKALKTSRWELMNTFGDPGMHASTERHEHVEPNSAQLIEREIRKQHNSTAVRRAQVAEYLGLSPGDHLAITKESFLPVQYWEDIYDHLIAKDEQTRNDANFEAFLEDVGISCPIHMLWGYLSRDEMLNLELPGNDQAESSGPLGLGFLVDKFLPVSGLSVTEWLLLIKTQTCAHMFRPFELIDGQRLPTSPQYRIRMEPDSIDSHWHKLQAFLRLRYKTGLSIPELDFAVTTFSGFDTKNDRFETDFLEALATVLRVQRLVEADILDLLILWGPITQERSIEDDYVYQNFFIAKRFDRLDENYQLLSRNGFRDKDNGQPQIVNFQLVVSAIIGLSQQDLLAVDTAIINLREAHDGSPLPGLESADGLSLLTVSNLSILLRCATLIRVAGIPAGSLGDFMAVFPDVFASPMATFNVLTIWRKASSSGLTIAALRFILQGTVTTPNNVRHTELHVIRAFSLLVQDLMQSDLDFFNAGVEKSNTLQQTIAVASTIFKRAETAQIKDLLLGQSKGEASSQMINLIEQRMLDAYGPSGIMSTALKEVLAQDATQDGAASHENMVATKSDALYDFMASSVRASKRKQALHSFVDKISGGSDVEMAKFVFTNLVHLEASPTSTGQPRSSSQEVSRSILNGEDTVWNMVDLVARDTTQPWEGYLLATSPDDIFLVTSDESITSRSASRDVDVIVNDVHYPWTTFSSLEESPPDTQSSILCMAGPLVFDADLPLLVKLPPGEIRYKIGRAAITKIPTQSLIPKECMSTIWLVTDRLLQHTSLFTALSLNKNEVEVLYRYWPRTQSSSGLSFDLEWVSTLQNYTELRQSINTMRPGQKDNLLVAMNWISQADQWRELSDDQVAPGLAADAEHWKSLRASLPILAHSLATVVGCSNLNIESLLAVSCISDNPNVVLQNLRRARHCLFRFLEMLSSILNYGLSGFNTSDIFYWAEPYGFNYGGNANHALDSASALKKQVRMAMSDEDWGKLNTGINNELREGKRDALISALLRHPVILTAGIRDANGLYDYLFVDTQMSPALKTSRIKQATSVVQTFTQRCVLELETDLVTGESFKIDQEQWQWLKRFRVWEANRRVYLTPETWLSMSTLDIKSELMAAFESDLSQGVIEWSMASNALSRYLLALNDVSDLLYIAQHVEDHGNGQQTLHLFARTRMIPATYYYRSRHSVKGYKPWQKMDLDIMTYDSGTKSGQYLLPWVRNGRLFLFLPEFKLRRKPTKPADMSGLLKESSKPAPETIIGTEAVEISIAWSEYRNGAWSKKTNLSSTYLDSWTTHKSMLFEFKDEVNRPRISSKLDLDELNYPIVDQSSLLDSYHFNLMHEENGTLIIPIIRTAPPYEYELVVKAFETDLRVIKEEKPAIAKILNVHKDDRPKVFPLRPQNFSVCSFEIDLAQFNIQVIDERQYYETDVVASSFGLYQENQLVSWAWGAPEPVRPIPQKQLLPTIVNDNRPTHDSQEPYTSVLIIETSSKLEAESLCNKTSHVLVDAASTSTPIKAIELLSTLSADFGRRKEQDAEYNVLGSAYGVYNWELGLFMPMLLAERFLASRQFDLALRAISMVFDPLNNPQQRFQGKAAVPSSTGSGRSQWKFHPFRQLLDIESSATAIVLALADESARPTAGETTAAFNPHAVSRGRSLNYMKWVVIRFVEILIEWADAKFRDDTLESLPEAILLYTQASNVVGPRLQLFDRPAKRKDESYSSLSTVGFVTEFESMFPWDAKSDMADFDKPWLAGRTMTTEHFSIPAESKLMDLRDRIDDRLFKIRHSMDIKGAIRTLALYEPQLDPGRLVRAFAAGSFNLANALNNLNVPLVNVRFTRLVSRALGIVKDLRRFGITYLDIIKAKDDQGLATLLASQDQILNKMKQEVATLAVQTATSAMHSMKTSRELIENRMKHFYGLIGAEEASPPKYGETFKEIDNAPPKMISDDAPRTHEEETWLKNKIAATSLKAVTAGFKFAAGVAGYMPKPPEVKAAPAGVGTSVGFPEISAGLSLQADAAAAAADVLNDTGEIIRTTGEYKERMRERKLELNELGGQLMLLDQELVTQNTLIKMAEKEVQILERELDWNNFIADWQRATRVTNDSFYTWLQAEYHGIYYQTYSLAYDMAKKAEQALFMELGLPAMDPIIDFGCWDVSRNGLLAAEKLYNGLRRLEQAFAETRAYDFEIAKKVSIKSLDTNAFTAFTTTVPHAIEFWLPEELFDLDFPGHYKRRIRTVSIGIAADGREISAELTLLKHKYRVSARDTESTTYGEKRSEISLDTRFRSEGIPINAIGVTVGTQSAVRWVQETAAESSSGLFEINFGGDSYLPFEGAGAISQWRLEISPFSEIDPRFIKDMVMTIQYTASRGPEAFRKAAIDHVAKYVASVPSEKPGLGYGRTARV